MTILNNFKKWNVKCFIFYYLGTVAPILLFYFYFEYLVTFMEELKLYIFWINAIYTAKMIFFFMSPAFWKLIPLPGFLTC
jgi:hypothetical protein